MVEEAYEYLNDKQVKKKSILILLKYIILDGGFDNNLWSLKITIVYEGSEI